MTFSTFYGVFLIALIVAFLGMVVKTYSRKNKTKHEQAANLVFADEPAATKAATNSEVKP